MHPDPPDKALHRGRAVCPAGNARRMVATAAHLADYVFPRLPVRQWVLARINLPPPKTDG